MMMAFLLQAGITDAVSGYLPRTFTARLLLGGLALGDQTFQIAGISTQLAEIAATVGLMALLSILQNRGERLGQGDLWLITGLTAWMGERCCPGHSVWSSSLCSLAANLAFPEKRGTLGPGCVLAGVFSSSLFCINLYGYQFYEKA
jgi:prepilin signal peptidase PulO-like enzyme (type II secretory pathway)